MATEVEVTRVPSDKTLGQIEAGELFTADGLLWMRGKLEGTGDESLIRDVARALDSIPGGVVDGYWIFVICMHAPYIGQVSVMLNTVPVEPVLETTIAVRTTAEVKPIPFLPDPE